MINFKQRLDEYGLNTDNSVVIGSGVMNALGLRESADIDVVVNPETYERLRTEASFVPEVVRGKTLLTGGVFEIGTSWPVLGRDWDYRALLSVSMVIEDVRYITAQFLREAKRSWIHEAEGRDKDVVDVRILEKYLL